LLGDKAIADPFVRCCWILPSSLLAGNSL